MLILLMKNLILEVNSVLSGRVAREREGGYLRENGIAVQESADWIERMVQKTGRGRMEGCYEMEGQREG
jgi:hypothetical protein